MPAGLQILTVPLRFLTPPLNQNEGSLDISTKVHFVFAFFSETVENKDEIIHNKPSSCINDKYEKAQKTDQRIKKEIEQILIKKIC